MKRIILVIASLLAIAAPAIAAGKSPIEGRWKRGSMVIEIAPCGPDLCGTVVKASENQKAKAKSGSGTDLVGAQVITGIERTGDSTYRGRVFLAGSDRHATGTIEQVSPNQLRVKGCILAVLCKSRTYVRVR